MTAQEFCYWLKGYLELSEVDLNKIDFATTLSREQVKCINEHLGYVFAAKVSLPLVRTPSALELLGTTSLDAKIC